MITLIKVVFGRPQTASEASQIYSFQNSAGNKTHIMAISSSTLTNADNITYQDGYVTAFDDATVAANYQSLVNGFTPGPQYVGNFSSV